MTGTLKVKIGIGEATVSGGSVCREDFTVPQADDIAFHMDRLADTQIPVPLRDAWKRAADMFSALSNDTDIFVVVVPADAETPDE